MYKVRIVGGLCGTTMLRAAELIRDACNKEDILAKVEIQNIFEKSEVDYKDLDVLVQMIPLYERIPCLLLSGKAFITHIGEKKVINNIVNYLKEKKSNESIC